MFFRRKKKEISENKQFAVNLLAQIAAFIVNFAINFFLTPYILENVGREAYGFVSLGNNFVSYITLASTALNSMAGRFITIKIHQKKIKDANIYYSSVIAANLILAVVLSVPCILIVIFLNQLVNVSNSILLDVQMLWALLFTDLILGLFTSTFGVLLFSANRIDIQAKRTVESNLIKAVLLVILFSLFHAYVWYIGLATLIASVYGIATNLYYARKFYPEIRFSRKNFSPGPIKELLASGIWNTVSKVGSIALTELDLLLSNLFLSAEAMGTLSIAKTVPNYVSSFASSLTSAFMPKLTITYAKGDKQMLINDIRSCMRILLFFNSIIFGILFGFVDVFYQLWLPDGTQDVHFIYQLSLLTISGCFVSAISYIMTNIFTVTNRIRFSSLVVIGTGALSFIITYIALRYTGWGLYAVAGISVLLTVVRNICILVPYGAKCIEEPWYRFFPDLGLNIGVVLVAIIISLGMKRLLIHNYSWTSLIFACLLTAMVLLILNYFVVLKKVEREKFKRKLKKIIKR